MSKSEDYRAALAQAPQIDEYLLAHSNLPGPRANLELLYAAAAFLDEPRIQAYLSIPVEQAPGDSPPGFLTCCGVVALGGRIAAGQAHHFSTLRRFAADPRWRVREAAAMALQLAGDADMPGLLAELRGWLAGGPLAQRAVVAALCEPRLLTSGEVSVEVLRILDEITTGLLTVIERKREEVVVLQKGLSYGWSVAVAANPAAGKPLMEKWLACPDALIRKTMQENLGKNRLVRMDAGWVRAQLDRMG